MVPEREQRERTAASIEQRIPIFERLKELSGKLGLDVKRCEISYRGLGKIVLTMPENDTYFIRREEAMESTRERFQALEEKYPGCSLETAKKEELEEYINVQHRLCLALWARDEAVAECIYKEYSASDGLLQRMGDEPLILCAATVYGTKIEASEAVPSRELREKALRSVEQGIPAFDRMLKLNSGKPLDELRYRKMCREILTLPEGGLPSDEELLQTLQEKTDRFFRDHSAEFEKGPSEFSKETAEDYVDLAYPVLCALRRGSLTVADYVTFGVAPNRDPFFAAGDFWIKSAAAAVVGQEKTNEGRYDWPMTMKGLIDFFVAFGVAEEDRMEREGTMWSAIPSPIWREKYGIDEDGALFDEWWDTAFYNVMNRLGHDLDFYNLEQIWYRGGANSLGELWRKDKLFDPSKYFGKGDEE